MTACNEDSDCDIEKCFYCLSTGICGLLEIDFCEIYTCGSGDGDCDSGECPSGTFCGTNNFLDYHPLLKNCPVSKSDVCVTDVPTTTCISDSDCNTTNCFYCLSNGICSLYDSYYCDNNVCGSGDGDCDSTNCPSGTYCGRNNFLDYHPLLENCEVSQSDVCVADVPTKTCISDSDCNTRSCFYCLSNGTCSHYDSEYCDNNVCGIGDGDCDPGTCPLGSYCGSNNFIDFHPLLDYCFVSELEVCIIGKKESEIPKIR